MCRELRETFQRLDSFAQEVKRKDSKMKELQQRLEAGQGCKLLFWLVSADFRHADLKFIYLSREFEFITQGGSLQKSRLCSII
jgi:hypothetical protein